MSRRSYGIAPLSPGSLLGGGGWGPHAHAPSSRGRGRGRVAAVAAGGWSRGHEQGVAEALASSTARLLPSGRAKVPGHNARRDKG
uniref:Uncharacterized protein n=1 Tax=Oryza sativa subsp. japonica TaxID=39947 RepID=Q6K1R2_ORYSJ|nr:hypothetical protein [Oryza sativa Japonica Group]